MKRRAIYSLLFSTCVLIACQSPESFPDAVAIWSLSDLNDGTDQNSVLQMHKDVSFVALKGDEAKHSKLRGGDGMAARFKGGWLDAGQGANEEVNLTGKNISILVRVKADRVEGYTPILTKAGNDQSIAYTIALNTLDGDTYIESLMGSDEIGGAHLLKYKLPEEEITGWHDIVLRFNGKMSELYVDGQLRDDEVTVGEIRDWNRKPLLIGAQYNDTDGYGEQADIKAESLFDGLIDHVALWNRCLTDQEIMKYSGVDALKDGRPAYYSEAYRPQFHFTAKKNWLNDPNGLVYYDGVYHLFFQYMPPHRPGAYKDWGHAVSTDLVHWEQIPEHITPHKVWSGCWSGSAVVDEHNVAGFQQGDKKAIIAFITNGGHPDAGLGPLCTQCIAYSTDGGTTFTYYDRNPVIKNIHNANRDPKVVWDENTRQWVMSLYMDKGCDFGLFTSDNLKDWKHVSTITLDGVTECPGFVPLPVDGDKSKQKWLFFGANGNYQIGTFDGVTFKPETKVLRGDYGKNFYAAMTWSNVPDGRCLHIAWMPTRRYPGMPYEQQMNFPTEVTLRTTPEGIKAFRMPAREISKLYDQAFNWDNTILSKGKNLLADLNHDLYDMQFEINVKPSSSFDIEIRGARIHYDASRQVISCKGPTVDNKMADLGDAPLKATDSKIRLRILVDRTSIELFGNDGEAVITSNFMPEVQNKSYSFTSEKDLTIVSAEVHTLKSAWNK